MNLSEISPALQERYRMLSGRVWVSLDGPPALHDETRGAGAEHLFPSFSQLHLPLGAVKAYNHLLRVSENLRTKGGGRVLVGSAVFKTVSRALIPFWVGSIPMHLRQSLRLTFFLIESLQQINGVARLQGAAATGLIASLMGLLILSDLIPCWGSGSFSLPDKRVIVFSGHTARPNRDGTGRGAKSASGVYEFRFNDSITELIGREKTPGVTFVTILATRNVPLKRRVALARRLNADVIVEIHHDSVQPRIYEELVKARIPDPLIDRYRGFSLHVYPDEDSISLAASIEDRMIAAGMEFSLYHQEDIPGERMELAPGTKAVYLRPNLHLPRTSDVPTVIVECGCIANPEEERLLSRPEYKRVIARAVRRGIGGYLGIRGHVSVSGGPPNSDRGVFRLRESVSQHGVSP